MYCFLPFAVLLMILVGLNTGAPNRNLDQKYQLSQPRGRLSDECKAKLRATCKTKSNRCKGQTNEYKESRKRVKSALVTHYKSCNAYATDNEADNLIEQRLQKIYQLKKKLNQKNNVTDIEPADDGLWQGDITLTIEQADFIMKTLDNPQTKFSSNFRQKRSAATFFEQSPASRWKMPIHYWISPSFTTSEKATIDDALNTISTSSGCIKFAKDTTRLSSGSQMQFVKPGIGCYGSSDIGFEGINLVNVATVDWCKGDILKGLVMHETIHALGGGHEQSRPDRDQHIEILWDNIDPQKWYNYEIDTSATSYGVSYDYKSVMHYQQGGFATAEGLDTMRPFVNTELGGNRLSSNDILQLKRMYCKASTCADTDQECGTWAVDGWCSDPEWKDWMKTNCAKSCAAC